MTEKRGAPPGSNNGGGRKPSPIPLENWSGKLQKPADGKRYPNRKVRLAIDTLEKLTNAIGSPHFSADAVLVALKDVDPNGSLLALLNILPDLEKAAKENY